MRFDFWRDDRPVKKVLVRFPGARRPELEQEPKFYLSVNDQSLTDQSAAGDNTFFQFQVDHFIRSMEKIGYKVLVTLE